MNSIYVCFSLKSASFRSDKNELLEKDYQSVYKPVTRFLYSHPDFNFSFQFSGNQINYFKKRKNEFITICRQLVERDQIEILGGGYYDPVLPLLSTVDCNGQIDMLSAEIRPAFGKRPRGISLFADCWDSSLVNPLQTCGIEYVLVDSSSVPQEKRKYLPLIMSNLGKAIEIFPCYDSFRPERETTAKEFVLSVTRNVEKIEKKDKYFQCAPCRIVNINLTHQQMIELIESKFFENLDKYLKNNPNCRIKTTTPLAYKKIESIKVPAYIPCGINGQIAKFIPDAYKYTILNSNNNYNVYDFMDTYPRCHSLLNRIVYMTMLINQYKNDKMRKKAAREKLWQAQSGFGLICTQDGTFSTSKDRQQSYKYLMEAEKILREDGNFKETISSFDYNGDGINEYILRMNNYFAYISLIGGAIQELEILKNTGNYADNLSRILEFDGCNDDYERGLFIDHILSDEQYQNYINGEPSGNGVFSKIKYSEIKFSQSHREITLCAEAVYGTLKQKIYLRKKYIINSDGMNIQYILRNESERKLKIKFGVESNFSHTCFEQENLTYYDLEVADNQDIINIDTKKSVRQLLNKGKLQNVQAIRLTDEQSGVSFGLEPNENAQFFYMPLTIKRPVSKSIYELKNCHMSFVNTFFWDVELEPGMETEKTLNFTITNVKKR
ncbi:MAG: DUF1926 domain-containing protein [Treponema sp.]|nr:DUF1926 domain-containing protein [Treponema sp.]